MNYPRGVAILFELRLGLRIKISIIGDPYVNHPTHSQSKLDDGSELTVPKVTVSQIRSGWIDKCHDLRWVRK